MCSSSVKSPKGPENLLCSLAPKAKRLDFHELIVGVLLFLTLDLNLLLHVLQNVNDCLKSSTLFLKCCDLFGEKCDYTPPY